MTAALELDRIAKTAIPPIGATMAVAVVDHQPGALLRNGSPSGKGGRTRHGAAWLVDGLRVSEAIAWFDRPRDALRLVDLLNGEASRPAPDPDLARTVRGTASDRRDVDPTPPEASRLGASVSPRSCVVCGRDLLPGSRSQRRTCSDRCRRARARQDATEQVGAELRGAEASVPLSEPSHGEPGPHPG